MKVDKDTLRKIAHLARLDFEDKDEQKMLESISEILTWVEKLNELDTSNVEPLTTMSKEMNVFRPDEVKHQLEREEGLVNAPEKNNEHFIVPKVLE
ncbi:Asp-tRNA(Asn)/Glu-tRNA(Gln) amidotransferase subunit GatC [Fulvivirgaceae bacterium BMA10]|uniref:Aspartyl/glutamyl-tRNA(Asn/Gln) amidotransferase subunit C n=1 Tax=Splendidivirga corallicola TaxID=3051826 RepID=A0ABT8KRQ6_9BACT|nr:Asp-tRNA(Asn)/Glu-tRNA(Gln) amidotransferase subunit GatC [Fulvivirgaceae bacterium BMA10]